MYFCIPTGRYVTNVRLLARYFQLFPLPYPCYFMNNSVLICGASIAGLTTAFWLQQYGYAVTVVERAAGPRMGGSPVDIRGTALDIVQQMGLFEQLLLGKTDIEHIEFKDALDATLGRISLQQVGAQRPNQDLELVRDHLVQVLYAAIQHQLEFLFENSVLSLEETETGVQVRLQDQSVRSFALVIGADGVHSTIRKLVFGAEHNYKHFLGEYFAIFPLDPALGKACTGELYNTPGKMSAIYSYHNQAEAILAFLSPPLVYDYRDQAQQKQIMQEAFANSAWKIPAILAALASTETFYFDELCQIKMPCWTSGRVALVGDAGYCASGATGMGTTPAIVGAATLAQALAAAQGDYTRAFPQYEQHLRPIVEQAQASVQRGLDFLIPKTEAAIHLRNQQGY